MAWKLKAAKPPPWKFHPVLPICEHSFTTVVLGYHCEMSIIAIVVFLQIIILFFNPRDHRKTMSLSTS